MRILNIYASWLTLLLIIGIFHVPSLSAQNISGINFNGVVLNKKDNTPIAGAAVNLPEYGVWAITDSKGFFSFKNLPEGNTQMTIRSLGMVALDETVKITKTLSVINFYMEEANFSLDEVLVVAQTKKTGASTSSSISRSAIDHLQATSLSDIMELLPGQLSSNPNLTSAAKPSLRQVMGDAMNSMGTSILVNGSPISNNANLQIGNTAKDGVLTTDYTSTAGSGVDMRRISADNIESVDVIRGIPSVEYGDLTSGVILVTPKAGASNLMARLKINPTLTQASVSKGFDLGEKGGSLSANLDYSKSLADERRPYQGFERLTTNLLYSTEFLGRINMTTGLGFYSDLDAQKLDPSDVRYQRKRSASNTGYNFNTNVTLHTDNNFLKSIRLIASADYTVQEGYMQEIKGDFNYLITTAMKDGTVASNRPDAIIGKNGEVITNTDMPGYSAATNYLPYEFLTKMTTYGKPLNIFAKLTANMYADIFGFGNRIITGTEWRTDVNFGRGKVFDPMFPQSKGLRKRPYTEIPALNQFSLFAEDNITKSIFKRDLKVQFGLRLDMIQPGLSEGKNVLSPRFNISYGIIPDVLSVRGGWGITAKAPPLVYLYPENAYFDYSNFNNIGQPGVGQDQELSIITTKVYNTSNPDLKIAKNTKTEFGFDLNIRKMNFSITAFREKLKDGYSFDAAFSSFNVFDLITYKGTPRSGTYPSLEIDNTSKVVASYNTPVNNRVNETKGVEFDFNFGRIAAIHTSLVFNGAWMRTDSYSSSHYFYQKSNDADGRYKDIGVYKAGDGTRRERFLTNLRMIHNIPKISFVFSISVQTIWNESNKFLGLDNTTPIGYLDVRQDLKYVALNPGDAIPEDIQRRIPENQKITDSYGPLWLFNLRLTKEIKNKLGFTFFLNNVFTNQPLEQSKRNPGNFITRNPSQFFGMEVWAKF